MDTQIKDEEILKLDAIEKLNNKSAAIKERIEMNEQYEQMLAKLQKRLSDKGAIYNEIINEGTKIISDMRENKVPITASLIEISKPNSVKPKTPAIEEPKVGQRIQYNKEVEKTDACTCLLF